MIISNGDPDLLKEFGEILNYTDKILNGIASSNENYFLNKGGKALESEVFKALNVAAKNTSFDQTIKLVSGASFPDIIARKFYGVEVKSTEKNQWQSIGSSILESTRDKDVERIFMTFGKLGKPVQFITKPYEDCLSDIVVTHYPRYKIDMKLQETGRNTIFEKMHLEYDVLRKMENPVPTVSDYYKRKLQPGQSLWWAADDVEQTAAPMTAKLWATLNASEKSELSAYGFAFFPETICSQRSIKYQRFALWLATNKGVINTNIRDSFSAGGKYEYLFSNGNRILLPAICGRLISNKIIIIEAILNINEDELKEYWGVKEIETGRILQWQNLVLQHTPKGDIVNMSRFLHEVFVQ